MSDQSFQVRRNVRKHVLQLLFTGAVIGCFLATLRIFRAIGDFSPGQKTAYSGISTALILILGLNFFDAVKNLAEVAPKIILEQRRYRFSNQERDLIAHLEKWSNVLRLMSISFSKSCFRPLIGICCIAWVLFFLSGQTALALTSVIIAVNDGTNYTHIYTRHGNPCVANISRYFHYDPRTRVYECPQNDIPSQETVQALAHLYGESARGSLSPTSECGEYTDISRILDSKVDYRYYCRRTPGYEEFAYRFSEYNPDDTQNIYPSFTNRTITASSGPCFEYDQTGFTNISVDGISGRNHSYRNESGFEGSIFIPLENDIDDSTTYIWRGDKTPQDATYWKCGARCIWMWAHKSASADEVFPQDPKSTFFQCPISVSHVNNATKGTELDVPDGIARIAASAIALQGRTHGKPPTWSQWQFYAIGNVLETHNVNVSVVGANMAEFAIGSISTMVLQNPRIKITGEVPYLSSYLSFTWSSVFALLASVFGAHLLICIVIVYINWYSSGSYSHLQIQQRTSTQPLINTTSNPNDQFSRPQEASGEYFPLS